MASFKIALAKILTPDVGYINDSEGEIYKGIPRKFNPKWWGWLIIDIEKSLPGFPENLDSNKDLRNKVERIYKDCYWNEIKGNGIHKQKIANEIFSYAVNGGVRNSIKIAQKIARIKPDGIVGKRTLKKLNNINTERFVSEFKIKRIKKCVELCERYPNKWPEFKEMVLKSLK